MTVTITITGNSGPETVQELFTFLGNMHVNLSHAAKIPAPSTPAPTVPAKAVEAEEPPKKSKKAAKEEVKTDAPAPKATLQQAIDQAKEIVGDGEDAEIMNKLQDLNKRFGIAKVRELPPEKLDAYIEELDKTFPKKASGGMFD